MGRVRTHDEGVEGAARQGRKIAYCSSESEKGFSPRSHGLVGGGVLRIDYRRRSNRSGYSHFQTLVNEQSFIGIPTCTNC